MPMPTQNVKMTNTNHPASQNISIAGECSECATTLWVPQAKAEPMKDLEADSMAVAMPALFRIFSMYNGPRHKVGQTKQKDDIHFQR
mmetsp:Transcript_123104/g.274930  ORF Transcript_123104/g.274930 Transcript_123104/m.274930 type:complete len:87 (-) Transcript_123104:1394-1654(-)